MLKLIALYLTLVNLIAWILFGVDKWKAKHARWRIPEITLLGLAVLGGSIGAWCGMKNFHHKTQHKKFYIGIPFIFILQIALVLYGAFYLYSGMWTV